MAIFSEPENGDTYGPGEEILARVIFSNDVFLTRAPQVEIEIDIGGAAKTTAYHAQGDR